MNQMESCSRFVYDRTKDEELKFKTSADEDE